MRCGVLSSAICAALCLLAVQTDAVVDEELSPAILERDSARLPSAELLLAHLRSTFPSVPLRLRADLILMTRSAEIERRLGAELFLNWNAAEPEARYTLFDAFGTPLEELTLRWRADGSRTCRYRAGNPLADAPPPDLSADIQGTDLNWLDLSLAYLRWPNGKTVGAENIRGRFCYIVDAPAPLADDTRYAGVRLWIDPQIGLLLQAAAYDRAGNLEKMLEVKSFKKIRDVWVIKDIDVQRYPARHRTRLRVLSAEPVE